MQANELTYIWPPRASVAIQFKDAQPLYEDLGWEAQLKYNDTRLLIKFCKNGNIELWNRHAEKLRSYNAPDWLLQQLQTIIETLGFEKNAYHLFDGGLLDQKHRAIKDTIVIWDILVQNGQHLLGTTYEDRHSRIHPGPDPPHWDSTLASIMFFSGPCDREAFWYEGPKHEAYVLGTKLADNIFVPRNIKPSEWAEAWDMIQRINEPFVTANPPIGPLLEGLVFKDPEGTLDMGWSEKNNSAWMARSRVSTGRHAF